MYIGSANLQGSRHQTNMHITGQNNARLNMVNGQLRTNKVHNEKLITAMSHLPREAFLPPSLKQSAYLDEDILVENSRFLMEPMVLARILEFSDIQPNDAALLVGFNTGYEAAVIAILTENLFVIEPDTEIAAKALKNLAQFSLSPQVIEQDFNNGETDKSPFDIIIFNGAITELPPSYKKQLKNNGKIIAIERFNTTLNGVVVLYENIKSHIGRRALFDASCPYLTGMEPSTDHFNFT